MIMPRRPFTPIFIPLLWLLIVAGCSSAPDLRLQEVEAMMEQSPDSALVIISGVDTGTLHSDADKALYNLLLTQVCYKNYRSLPPDSVIGFSVRYYTSADDSERLMQSLYYQAVVFRENGNINSAITPALHSEELARKLGSPLWIARTNELLSDIFYDNYSWEESMRHAMIASDNYRSVNKSQSYMIAQEALILSQVKDYDGSLHLLDSIMASVGKAQADSMLMAYCLKISISTLLYKGNLSDAKNKVIEYLDFSHLCRLSANDYINFAELYIADGDMASAEKWLNLAENSVAGESERTALDIAKSHYDVALGDYTAGYNVLHDLLDRQVDKINMIQKESPVIIERNYYDAQVLISRQKIYWMRWIIIVISVFFLIAFIVGVIIYRLRIKVKNLEIRKSLTEIHLLSDKVRCYAESQKNDTEKKRLNHSLYEDRFRVLSLLCDEYFDNRETNQQLRPIHRQAKNEIEYLRQSSTLQMIESLVDENMDNIMSKLRSEIPDLTEGNYKLAMLVYVGVSLRTICLVIDSTLHNLSNKVGRLRKKILSSDAADKEWFAGNLKVKKYSISKLS